MMNWIKRLVGGWIPIGTKPFGEWAGKLIWVLGVIITFNIVTSLLFRQPNKNSTTTIVLPFARVERLDQKSIQKNEERRKWWQPIPYVSVAGEMRMTGLTTETGAKVEAGLRWDF